MPRTRSESGGSLWGLTALAALAVASAVSVLGRPLPAKGERVFWTFAIPHFQMYGPIVEAWNKDRSPTIQMRVLGRDPMERRMMAAFMAGTPSCDLMESERRIAARAFTGPLDAVGFSDLTERINAEGIRSEVVAASLSPWTTRGRIFGLPHDVHPVMLGYRADLVEAAGIDVSAIETWADFARVLAPLMGDSNGDGKPDRYLLNMWPTAGQRDHLEVLLLQAGGGFFDDAGRVTIATDANARVLAAIVRWSDGPTRICADAPNFNASGNQLKVDGYVVASFFPDWMCDVWKHEMPQLAGKMKLMPLPAWDNGGRRTSVWGGTMLGIPKTAVASPADFDALWAFAKHLYLSDELARVLYRTGGIVTPVKRHWADPIFDEPNPYFSGQAPGRMYIGLAENVPARTSSPFNTFALDRVQDALTSLFEESRGRFSGDEGRLRSRAMELLRVAEDRVRAQIDRNVFLRAADQATGTGVAAKGGGA